MGQLKQKEMRDIALSTARWQVGRLGLQLADVNSTRALHILDEMNVSQPDKTASIWYRDATEAQIRAFRKEWNKYKRGF